jgi:antitoxin component YwqK of YwqJK toxin-antitoxin module
MKRKLILLLVIISSCSKENSKIDKQLEKLNIISSNFKKIDTVYLSEEKIKSLTFYKSDKNYIKIEFHNNDTLKSYYQIDKGQFHSKTIDWFKNGKIKWIRYYNHGNQIGLSTFFNEKGIKKKEFNNETDETTYFFENGLPKLKYSQESTIYYYDNGNKFEEFIKTNDSKNKNYENTSIKFYNENGEIVFSGSFKDDLYFKNNKKYTGKIICYFKNGKRSMVFNIKNGITQGKYYCFFGNGNLKFEGKTLNGNHLYRKDYYSNGKIMHYRNKAENINKNWDENGKLIK